MFPPQTSLIPVTVALGRFAEEFINREGWLAIRSLGEVWYPYWYLGVPYRYLTGPLIPLISFYAHKIFPNVSLFGISIYLIALSFVLGSIGWGRLAAVISKNRQIGIIVGVVFLILPWKYLSSIAFSEATVTISKNLLPYVLLTFWNYYKERSRKNALFAVIFLAFLLLINTTTFTLFIVGISSLYLAASFRDSKIKIAFKKIKPSLILIFYSLIIVTVWYTPSYWLTAFLNPSIGGAAGYKVLLRIVDLFRASFPLMAAIFAVYFSGKVRSKLTVFSLTWTLTFLFLTLFRFIGDPDFWQDWTSWFFELETGIALIAALPILVLLRKFSKERTDTIYSTKIYIAIFVALVTPFLLTKYIYSVLGKPRVISNELQEGVRSLSVLADLAKESRVFLSGSTVFWANALYDLAQVRGGVDKAAVHPLWDHAAYQLREGDEPKLSLAWLQVLGVEYVLVHGPASAESYHDFRNLEKWNSVGQEIWQGGGDVIYKISDVSLAWEVNSEKAKSAKKPRDGKDLAALEYYLSARKFPVQVLPIKEGYEIVSEQPMSVVQISINFSKMWKVVTKEGKKLETQKDSFGNILVFPQMEKEILLKK